MTSFKIEHKFKVSAADVYSAWLDTDKHSHMTGGEARCSREVGGRFEAWDGYISGENILLEENEKIIQKWRTIEFASDAEDSMLELNFKSADDGCVLELSHQNIPEGQPDYKQGWIDNYFIPMEQFFGNS